MLGNSLVSVSKESARHLTQNICNCVSNQSFIHELFSYLALWFGLNYCIRMKPESMVLFVDKELDDVCNVLIFCFDASFKFLSDLQSLLAFSFEVSLDW